MNKEIDVMNYGPALESSETALNWLSRHNNQFGHFINGKLTSPKDTFQTIKRCLEPLQQTETIYCC